MPEVTDGVRIGEFSRRVGVSPELLRAWERRYGLLDPVRSTGGFRLYTDHDAERVGRMRRALEDGLSAAEAAQAALSPAPAAEPGLEGSLHQLMDAIHVFDEPEVHAVLDETLSSYGLESVLRDLILPALHRVGVEWERGELTVSQEHFASNVIRGRLLSMARLWGRGSGPLALLACAAGEAHDISLLMFGLLLRSYGWRILFLGADTPIATITETAVEIRPEVMVLATFNPEILEGERRALRRLAAIGPLLLCGPGATEGLCSHLDVPCLQADVVTAARSIAEHAYP